MNFVPQLMIIPGDLKYITPGSFFYNRPPLLLINPEYPALILSLFLPIIIEIIILSKPGSIF